MKSVKQQLKPQDILLLLKLVSINKPSWNQKPIVEALGLSQSEVSEAVARCKYSGYLTPNGKIVMKVSLMEFLQYGLRYVFPQKPGAVVKGLQTSHSAPPLILYIQSNEDFVWP